MALSQTPPTTNQTALPKQLGDGNTQGVLVNPALDTAGNAAKLGFFGTTPIAQVTPTNGTTTVAAGATTSVFVNTTFAGSTGTTAYTVYDIVDALKKLGLLKL